ncbi:MAG: hypothetical protein WA461_13850 [Nitrososphaeraceae archaeon]
MLSTFFGPIVGHIVRLTEPHGEKIVNRGLVQIRVTTKLETNVRTIISHVELDSMMQMLPILTDEPTRGIHKSSAARR